MIDNIEEVIIELRTRIEKTERMAGIMPTDWIPLQKKQVRKKRVIKTSKLD